MYKTTSHQTKNRYKTLSTVFYYLSIFLFVVSIPSYAYLDTYIICLGLFVVGVIAFAISQISMYGDSKSILLVLKNAFTDIFLGAVFGIIIYAASQNYIGHISTIDGSGMYEYENSKSYFICSPLLCKSIYSRGNVVEYSSKIGRIVGLPNEKITIIQGKLYINDVESVEAYKVDWSGWTYNTPVTINLNSDEYLILLDKRSGYLNPTKKHEIAGLLINKL